MQRDEFVTLAMALKDFIVDSIDEFLDNSDLPFDRGEFLQGTRTDLRQLAAEALIFGADTCITEEEDEDEQVSRAA